MANPWSRKTKPKGKLNLLAKAHTNGEAPVKPSLAALAKGKSTQVTPKKPTLRALVTTEPVVIERPYQEPKKRVKEDFRSGGLLYSGAEVLGAITAGHRDGIARPYGTVDVTNGDLTYTFHNRHGSWMHNMWNSERMAEPALVISWLGIDVHHVDMCRAMSRRFEAELKKQKVLTPQQQRAKLEETAAAARKRSTKPTAKAPATAVIPKLSLKGLKK